VLRGFALLGILPMNIQYFSMISGAYQNPTAYGDLTGANYWVRLFSHVLADARTLGGHQNTHRQPFDVRNRHHRLPQERRHAGARAGHGRLYNAQAASKGNRLSFLTIGGGSMQRHQYYSYYSLRRDERAFPGIRKSSLTGSGSGS